MIGDKNPNIGHKPRMKLQTQGIFLQKVRFTVFAMSQVD